MLPTIHRFIIIAVLASKIEAFPQLRREIKHQRIVIAPINPEIWFRIVPHFAKPQGEPCRGTRSLIGIGILHFPPGAGSRRLQAF
jgi:hypothetical protein